VKKNNKKSPILKLESVSKTYFMDGEEGGNIVKALVDASVQIFPKDFVAIIGPSGSGKSTLMHIMGLLDQPSAGNVYLNGTKTTSFSEEQLAGLRNTNIGFVFQQFNLLARTSALENVSLPLIYSGTPRPKRLQKSREMLIKVGLGDRLENTPAQLSGGQQQRVAIARALINDPAIIFADEPTGNLDSKSGKEIMDIFNKLNREGKTIIMVTHEKNIANNAHRFINVKDGRIV